MIHHKKLGFALACALVVVTGCATNPVTGENQLIFQSEAWDASVGAKQYAPARQMQGGDYAVDPAVVSYVQSVGSSLAAVSDNPLEYEFSVINNSVPNAWALPGGKIAVNRGLLTEIQSEAELAAVLGHEIVHAAARHGAQNATRGMLLQAGVFATALATSDQDYARYAVGGAQVAAQLMHTKYSRSAELEADKYGMTYMARAGFDPAGAVDLQETFLRLSQSRRTDWLSGLFATHPPSAERVNANRATATALAASSPSANRVGRDVYRQRIAGLLADKDAYEAYDKGRKALSAGDLRLAVQLSSQALAAQPREALFHGLHGDIDFAAGNYSQAVRRYSEALDRDPSYFKYYLGRGESYRALGQHQTAVRDLERSVKLLPTADALHGLGRLAEGRGDTDSAIRYYATVVKSSGSSASNSNGGFGAGDTPAGKQSYERLAILDLPRNPSRYVPARIGMDRLGRIYIEFANRSSVAIRDVVVEFGYRDDKGRAHTDRRTFTGTVGPGRAAKIVLGRRYAEVGKRLEARVRSARMVGATR